MTKSSHFSTLPAPLKILILGALMFAGLLVAVFFSFIIAFFFSSDGISGIKEIMFDVESPKGLLYFRFVQFVNHLLMFIIPALIFAYIMQKNIKAYHRLQKNIKGYMILPCLLLIILSIPLVAVLLKLNEALVLPDYLSGLERWMKSTEDRAMLITENILEVNTYGAFLFNLLIIAVVPAFSEELFFRGALQRIFHDAIARPFWPIILSGVIFSAFHLQFYSFLPRVYLGVLFAYIFWLTQNLWYPIILHFINNAFTVSLYFLSNKGVIDSRILKNEFTFSLLPVIISTLLIISTLWYIHRKHKIKTVSH